MGNKKGKDDSNSSNGSNKTPTKSPKKPEVITTTAANNTDTTSEMAIAVRVGSRMKKAKAIFDPSESYNPRKRPPTSNDDDKKSHKKKTPNHIQSVIKDPTKEKELKPTNYYNAVCLICMKPSGIKKNDRLIACKVCTYKAHVNCLDVRPDTDLETLEKNWQCSHCKSCVVCEETADAGILTECIICNDSYHAVCHEPRIILKNLNKSKFKCQKCVQFFKNTVEEFERKEAANLKVKEEKLSKSHSSSSLMKVTEKSDDSEDVSQNKIKSTKCERKLVKSSSMSAAEKLDDSMMADVDNDIFFNTILVNKIKEEPHEFIGFSDTETPDITVRCTTIIDSADDNSIIDCYPKKGQLITKKSSLENFSECSESRSDISLTTIKQIANEITQWNCNEVYEYFKKYFPKEATIFKDQEIDGPSLLLLKRSDIIYGLNLKLGPALNIYKHIVMLQSKDADPRLTWL